MLNVLSDTSPCGGVTLGLHLVVVVLLTYLEVCVMSRRHKMDRRHSKRVFSHTAGNQHVHPKNMFSVMPMRGGIRL